MDYINILWQGLVWIGSFIGLIIAAIALYYEFKQAIGEITANKHIQKKHWDNNINITKNSEK